MHAQLRHPQVAMVSPTGHPSTLLLVSQEQPVPVGWDLPPETPWPRARGLGTTLETAALWAAWGGITLTMTPVTREKTRFVFFK